MVLQSFAFGIEREFSERMKFLKEAEKYCYNSQNLDLMKARKKFIKSKMPKKAKKLKKNQ